jgi:threonine synthase
MLATAHPAKFPEICQQALGRSAPLPERLAATLRRQTHVTPLPNSYSALKAVLLE